LTGWHLARIIYHSISVASRAVQIPTTEIQPTPTDDLVSLDAEYAALKVELTKLKSGTVNYQTKFPLTQSEEKAAEAKIKELEAHFGKTYTDSKAFDYVWHGALSHHRIFWQDEKFLEAIKDPNVVKQILRRTSQHQFAQYTTLSSALIYGLSSNSLGYLFSAAPNWYSRPSDVNWPQLRDMNVPITNQESKSRTIDQKNVESYKSALDSIANVFEVKKNTQKVTQKSNTTLLDEVSKLIKDEKSAGALVAGGAGASTELGRMYSQCYEVMDGFSDLLKKHKGDYSAALGYGLVSHALDARHLAAAIYGLKSGIIFEERLNKGRENFRNFIEAVKTNKLTPPEANVLMNMRLQQILKLKQ